MEMRKILLGILLFCSFPLFGQKYRLVDGKVTFFSSAPMEDIKAETTKVRSLIDIETGEMAFVVPIRSFEFPKKLMQEHFNENYLESHKYPDATFKGRLIDYDRSKKEKQKVKARGELTIHGVTKTIEVAGTLKLTSRGAQIEAKFPVRVADYQIEIPQLVFYNIAEVVDVTLNGSYKSYEK